MRRGPKIQEIWGRTVAVATQEYQHGESLGEFPSHLEEEYATTEYPPSWVK